MGCVALDQAGHIAAGTSTGGTPNKMPGRVGDVPIIGSGFYADNEFGGASSTGWGESIAKVLLARLALHLLHQEGDPQVAAQGAIQILSDKANGFIAGADVREFTRLGNEDAALQLIRRGQGIFNRLESLQCPTIALLHGFCLGGGLELGATVLQSGQQPFALDLRLLALGDVARDSQNPHHFSARIT